MNCVVVATLIVSCIGVGVAIWGVCSSKKSSRKIMQQNKLDKIDWIQSELYHIDQALYTQHMRRPQTSGTERMKNEQAVNSLERRKADLQKQLEQLKTLLYEQS